MKRIVVTFCISGSPIVTAPSATTSMALTCRWRSRPQHHLRGLRMSPRRLIALNMVVASALVGCVQTPTYTCAGALRFRGDERAGNCAASLQQQPHRRPTRPLRPRHPAGAPVMRSSRCTRDTVPHTFRRTTGMDGGTAAFSRAVSLSDAGFTTTTDLSTGTSTAMAAFTTTRASMTRPAFTAAAFTAATFTVAADMPAAIMGAVGVVATEAATGESE
jgi:hypothetical protein